MDLSDVEESDPVNGTEQGLLPGVVSGSEERTWASADDLLVVAEISVTSAVEPLVHGVALSSPPWRYPRRTMKNAVTSCALVLTMLMIGAGCGGSDDSSTESIDGAPDAVEDTTTADEATSDATTDDSGDDTAAGFGDVIEGTFLLSGAAEEQYYVSDDELDFRTGGGCQDGAFGFGVNVQDAAGTTTFATFGAEGPQDLSGGVIGEFDDIDVAVTVFPGGDMSLEQRYAGPARMIISEHDTGGVDADPNARRMTVTLLGTIPGDEGDLAVDVTYRWVMGCP